jgi:hypothetical protein
MSAATILADETLQLRLKALHLPSFLGKRSIFRSLLS